MGIAPQATSTVKGQVQHPGMVTDGFLWSLDESLQRFLALRRRSGSWLNALPAPDWESAYQAPFGPICAGDIFAAWVAHDLLHMRQLVEIQWALLNQQVTPYSTRYAGDW